MLKQFLVPIILSLIIGIFKPLTAQIQYSQTLKGFVVDQDLKYPLIGATIRVLQDTQLVAGGRTDQEGRFRIEQIPVGRYTLTCSYLGYQDRILQNIEINSGKETQIQIEMQPAPRAVQQIVVRQKKGRVNNTLASVSARNFNPEEASRYVASREDIARMATNFAGVRGSDDSRNDIVIRGNTPNGVLWRIEGFDVSNPNHFASFGTTGGPVNIINNKLLGNSDFMTGAFPADYGNGISGVFDLRLRNGNPEKHEFTAQVGILGLEATAEGPLHKKSGSSYTFSYRYATLSIMNKLGINFGSAGNPSYQDLNLKMHFPLHKKLQLSVFALGGKSDIALLDNGEDSSKWTFGRAGRDIHFGSRFALAGAYLQHNVNQSFYQRFGIAANLNQSYSRYDTINPDKISRTATYRNQFIVNRYIFNYQATKRLSNLHTLKAGFIFTQMQMNLLDSNFYPAQNIWYNEAKFKNDAQLLQGWLAWQYSPNEALQMNVGLHYIRFLLNQSQSLEPRLGLQYQLSPKLHVSAGYGLHSNLQPMYIYFLQMKNAQGQDYLPNTHIGFNKTHHFVLGGDYQLNATLHFKAEVYYQSLFNIPQEIKTSAYTPLNQGASFNFIFPGPLENKGRGRNMGLDLTLEKYFSGQFYILSTASLYQSQYKGSDAKWRNTDFNGRYNLNVLSGKEWIVGKAKIARLIAGFKFNLAGGKWYSPIDSARSAAKRQYEGIDSLTNTLQFPAYHRLDIRMGFRKNLKRYHHHFYIDLINVYNKKNPLGLSYIPASGEVVQESNLGFLPLFNWLIEF
jgi:hypothetical protein